MKRKNISRPALEVVEKDGALISVRARSRREIRIIRSFSSEFSYFDIRDKIAGDGVSLQVVCI